MEYGRQAGTYLFALVQIVAAHLDVGFPFLACGELAHDGNGGGGFQAGELSPELSEFRTGFDGLGIEILMVLIKCNSISATKQ